MRVTVLNRAWLVATGLAAVVALPATHAMAQAPGSPTTAPQVGAPNANVTPSGQPDAGRVESLLQEARQAIDAKNTPLAVAKFREAATASAGMAHMAPALQEAARALVGGGVDASELALAPPADPQARKAFADRLMARGRLALDRGDIATGVQLARAAEAAKVPEDLYAKGESRPWQLLLDAESAARQRASQNMVTQASGQLQQGAVAQASGNAAGEMPGQVQQVQNSDGFSAPFVGGNNGQRLFREGMQALADGDRTTAREKFVEAWKYERELSPEVRQQLSEKLTLMQPDRLAPVRDGSALTPLDNVDMQQQAERQRLYQEVSGELSESQKISTSLPLEAVDRIARLRRRVEESSVDSQFKQQMLLIVDRAATEQRRYVEENRASIDLQLQNEQVQADIDAERSQNRAANEQVAQLVNEFNGLMRDRRYHEAETIARKVQLLKPDSEIAVQLLTTSTTALRNLMNEETQAAQEAYVFNAFNDIENSATGMNLDRPMNFGDVRDWEALTNRRASLTDRTARNESEELIRKKLFTAVDCRFNGVPLNEVLRTLATVAGVPIVIDQRALSEARVNIDEPITLDLPTSVRLRSALDLVLERYNLTWMIESEVLKVTSKERKNANVYPIVYKLADLVTPIPNFISGYEDGLAGAMRAAYQNTALATEVRLPQMSPFDLATNRGSMPDGQMNANTLAQYDMGGAPRAPGAIGQLGGPGGAAIADFDSLINLIQTTIEPDTWDLLGGPSTMQEYRANLTLVVSTTTDVHEQIADLLASLRRLQNLQVTIEVRFITLSDSFYERIGVDFDIEFDDNVTELPLDDRGPSVQVGLSGPNGLLTSDLDVQFSQGTFGAATPTFGNFVAGQGGQIGFAILSDIEAFFFLEAAQGDSRSNVMQAPKVTMFDGQIANVSDFTQRPFVTGIVPVVGDFAVAQQPVIAVLSEGTQLNVQAVVSNDKRFVRLTLIPMFTQINEVETFTYEGSRRTTNSRETRDPATGEPTENEDGETIVVGTTVQQPSFSVTSISTTVSVPDGGTILLGGIKRLRENRNEFGVPMLSKIPYVNRLFRNVGIGREATSLMMMVTPRIIIQEEEEIAQTGFDPTRP